MNMKKSVSLLYKEFEALRGFNLQRKKEIEELIQMFRDRADAEKTYAQKLQKIAQSKSRHISFGRLGEEVDSFRQDSLARCSQSLELADNIEQDCMRSLQELLVKQEEQHFSLSMEGRILLSGLHEVEDQLKERAAVYYRAAKEAEEVFQRYEQSKYSVELSFQNKQLQYESMLSALKKAKERESMYKESVDNANGFVLEFRKKHNALCGELLEIEAERCEAIHGAINKFVVYEKFSEMNNKYDVKNFSKLIEEYDTRYEVSQILSHLDICVPLPGSLTPAPSAPSAPLQETTASSVNVSSSSSPPINEDGGGVDTEENSPLVRESGRTSQLEALSKGGSLVMRQGRGEQEAPKFQFVQYSSSKLNLGKINSALITPPQERLSLYNEDASVLKYIFNKIFTESPLHEEYYLAMNNILSKRENRVLLMDLLEKRFNRGLGALFISKTSFSNIKETTDIFLYECNKHSDIEGLMLMMTYLQIFHQKALTQQSGADKYVELSLSFALKDHIIWKNKDTWQKVLEAKIQEMRDEVAGEEFKLPRSQKTVVSLQEGGEEDKVQESQEPKKAENEMIIDIVKYLVRQMVFFQLPLQFLNELVGSWKEAYFKQQEGNQKIVDGLTEIDEQIAQYEQREVVAAAGQEQKQPVKAQKGIPDWLKELSEPLEHLTMRENGSWTAAGSKSLRGLLGVDKPKAANQ